MSRILVVEDDSAMAEGIGDILELAGHEVFRAADGVHGLEQMGRVAPDLVLSDVMMPRMDGFAFYEAVRENPVWAFVPFVFLTALGQIEAVARGKRLGADDYLVKPVDPENLLATVESRIERTRAVNAAATAELHDFSRFVTGVLGHELRAPLSWIRAYTELIIELRGEMAPDDLDAALEGIKSGSDRLTRIVEDAVLLVRVNSGQAVEEFRVAAVVEPDLSSRLGDIVEGLRPAAEAADVALEPDIAPALPPVLVAPRFLAPILHHLVENGLKFCRKDEPRFVRVEARERAGGVDVVVADNGIGIAADKLERAFEPLVQIDRNLREQQGMGIGLALVRALVDVHGGTIRAESEPGVGTTIAFWLPAVSPPVV